MHGWCARLVANYAWLAQSAVRGPRLSNGTPAPSGSSQPITRIRPHKQVVALSVAARHPRCRRATRARMRRRTPELPSTESSVSVGDFASVGVDPAARPATAPASVGWLMSFDGGGALRRPRCLALANEGKGQGHGTAATYAALRERLRHDPNPPTRWPR